MTLHVLLDLPFAVGESEIFNTDAELLVLAEDLGKLPESFRIVQNRNFVFGLAADV